MPRVRVAALDATKVQLFTGRGEVRRAFGDNTVASKVYLQLYDAAATGDVTLGTTVPDVTVAIATSAPWEISFIDDPYEFHKGCVTVISTAANGSGSPASGSVANFELE